MRFIYPARLKRAGPDEIIVSFRDLPECLTSGANEAEALVEARDALEEAIAGRIDDLGAIPVPSARKTGECLIAVPTETAAKAALSLALKENGVTPAALARKLGTDERSVRRMLDPRHRTATDRLNKALRFLNKELVVEVRQLV